MVHPAEANRQPGRKLDRYELIAEIASGGMGTVYLARVEGVGGFQRLFAIKLMHPHLAKDPQFVAMLLDEARLAARIHHPNAVSIIDVCESDVGYYLVMEYVEGFTLDDILEHPDLGREEKVKLGLRVLYDGAVGLHAAHELRDDAGESLNLVHRDVSPQNILVGVDGVGRITDFGVARAAARITTSRPGMIKGKPCYMAPEQALGKDLDRRADVFALGIILWETLAGRMLFYSEAGDAAMLARVLNDAVPSLREENEAITAELEAVVMQALDRDVDARFQSARELAEALLAAARDADLIVTNHALGDRLEEIFAADVKARRASIQRHLEELGSGSAPIASDVFEQVPKLEQRPSHLAPAPDSGAWHEKSGASGGAEDAARGEDVGTAATKTATPSAQRAAADSTRPRSAWLVLAGIVLVVLGLGAWVVASQEHVGEGEIGAEVVPGEGSGPGPEPPPASETGDDPASGSEADPASETAGESASSAVDDEADPAPRAGEGSAPDPTPTTVTESPSDVDDAPSPTPRPRMRATTMMVVVEQNPYVQ